MAEVASAFVSLMPSAKGFGAATDKQISGDLDKTGKKAGGRFGAAIGKAVKVGAAVGGLALVGFAKSAIGASSQAQQSVGATETVFGKFADTVIKKSNRAAQQYGLSANEYRENANLIGSLFKNQGVASDQLAGKTDKMIGVGADLAATFGGTTKEAVEALGSAFKGEFNPMERYGVSLRQSTINSEAFRVAGVKSEAQFKRLSVEQQNAAKQQATTNLIMKQTADSQGQFGRESSTLAGQQQRLSASFENLKVTLGDKLLPVATRVVEWVGKFVAGMQNGTGAGGQFAAVARTAGNALASMAGFVKRNSDVILPLVAGLGAAVGTFRLISAATRIWAAAQLLLNLAMTANPIGIVIVAIAALVAGLVVAYKKSETFRGIVDGALRAVGAAGKWLWNNALKPAFSGITAAVRAVGRIFTWLWNNAARPALVAIGKAVGTVMKVWATMLRALSKVPGFGWAGAAARAMDGAADKALNLGNTVKRIPDRRKVTIDADTSGATAALNNWIRLSSGRRIRVGVQVASGIGMNAAGTNNWRGGLTWVGEKGPEILNLPRGSQIIPNHQTASYLREHQGSARSARGGAAVTQNIYTSDPMRAAREAQRQLAWAGAV